MGVADIWDGQKWHRPSFVHERPASGRTSFEATACELIESARNVLEAIARSQMLRCEVAAEITRSRIALEKIVRTLSSRRRGVAPPSRRPRSKGTRSRPRHR